uniref:DUF1802 family protein n=1 Tax=Mycobacterium tuberculosis TaxID=1773 RepID=UPI001F167D10
PCCGSCICFLFKPKTADDIMPSLVGSELGIRDSFRPKHKLAVLVVCAIPLAEPVRLARRPEYGGCTSWVQLPVTPTLAAPVHDEAALAEVAARVREAVG